MYKQVQLKVAKLKFYCVLIASKMLYFNLMNFAYIDKILVYGKNDFNTFFIEHKFQNIFLNLKFR